MYIYIYREMQQVAEKVAITYVLWMCIITKIHILVHTCSIYKDIQWIISCRSLPSRVANTNETHP